MLVVSPDLVTRFADGEIWLHTLETVKALSFPNLWVMSVLFHFARPTDENAFLEKIKPDERAQVGEVLSQLKEVGALKTVSGNGAAPAPQSNDLPGALVDAGLLKIWQWNVAVKLRNPMESGRALPRARQ